MNPNINSKHELLFNRDFILITIAGFIFFFNFHSFLLLPLMIESLGGDKLVIGLIMGLGGLSTLVSTPFVGVYADKYGKKIFLFLGALLLSLSTLPFAFINVIDFKIYVLRLIHGIAFSFFFISAGSLTADIVSKNRRTQALGIYGVFTLLNYAIAPFVGKKVLEHYSFDTFFKLVFYFGILVLPLIFFVKVGDKFVKSVKNIRTTKLHRLITSGYAFYIFIVLFFVGAAFISTITFLPVFAKSININSFHLFFVYYTLSTLAVRLFFGWIPDKYGKSTVTVPSLLLFLISMILLGFAQEINLVIISSIVFGIAHGFVYPSLYTLVIDNVSQFDRSKGFAACSLAFTSGGMVGTIISGFFAEYFGYKIMFLILALFVILAILFFISNKEFETSEN